MRIKICTTRFDYLGLGYGDVVDVIGESPKGVTFTRNGKFWALDPSDYTVEIGFSEEPKPDSISALDKQVSGNHYKDCKIQPIEYIQANGLSYLEGNVIKYTTRHSKKNGRADIEKAIHYLELILEMEYKGS